MGREKACGEGRAAAAHRAFDACRRLSAAHRVAAARRAVAARPAVAAARLLGGKIVYCERKGNIRVDVRARGRAKRSAPRKAAACAPGGTEGQ